MDTEFWNIINAEFTAQEIAEVTKTAAESPAPKKESIRKGETVRFVSRSGNVREGRVIATGFAQGSKKKLAKIQVSGKSKKVIVVEIEKIEKVSK